MEKFFTRVKEYAEAMRLPFLTASLFPFVAGSLAARQYSSLVFWLGLGAVIGTHTGANLLNDYADSRSGADWQDLRPFKFFGGTKLIQSGRFSEQSVLRLALLCLLFATGCVAGLALLLGDVKVLGLFILIVFLAAAYSLRPFQFAYRRVGEGIVFLLFGPALVMGGYFLQSGIFPDIKSFLLSLPFGFFTAAILLVNEIPDYSDDIRVGKRNLVSVSGAASAYKLYLAVVVLGFLSIGVCLAAAIVRPAAGWSFLGIGILPGIIRVLKEKYVAKVACVRSSQYTILLHGWVSAALIAGIVV
ncbi:MAG: hypothetical protein GF333_04415 [Candidatus Omnitrophica bacterium]|nr:hypothetical protein [Candidatus Omnitrophota bacterium]